MVTVESLSGWFSAPHGLVEEVNIRYREALAARVAKEREEAQAKLSAMSKSLQEESDGYFVAMQDAQRELAALKLEPFYQAVEPETVCRGECQDGTKDMCGVRSNGEDKWFCSRNKGHEGKHIACSTSAHNCYIWSQAPAPEDSIAAQSLFEEMLAKKLKWMDGCVAQDVQAFEKMSDVELIDGLKHIRLYLPPAAHALMNAGIARLEMSSSQPSTKAPEAQPPAENDSKEEQMMAERDDAEEAMSQAYYIVTGRSPEWSNMFGYKEALEEIEDALSVLRQTIKPLPTEVEMVELTAGDIEPGCIFRPLSWSDGPSFITLASVRQTMVCFNCEPLFDCDQAEGTACSWKHLAEHWQIKYPTGEWEACRKQKSHLSGEEIRRILAS